MGEGHTLMFLLLLAGAFLTAFYTFRLLFLAFSGSPRMGKEVLHHAHESPWVMTGPLVLLALATVVAGFVLGLPLDTTRFVQLLKSVFAEHEGGHSKLVPLLSVVVVVAGFVLALYRYKLTPVKPERVGQPSTPLRALLLNAYYVDALYDRVIVRPLFVLSGVLATRLRRRRARRHRQRRGPGGDGGGGRAAPAADRLRGQLRADDAGRGRGPSRLPPRTMSP